MPLAALAARAADLGDALRPRRNPVADAWSHADPARRRLVLLIVLAVLALASVAYLGVRFSGLSAVNQVTVTGTEGPQAVKLRQELTKAATGQSTLAIDEGALRRAVASDASVVDVTAESRFPHGVQIVVRQRRAVGQITVDGRATAVASDGVLLPSWPAGRLPVLSGVDGSGRTVADGGRSAVSLLRAAPGPLLAKVQRVDRGLVVHLRNGPALLFRNRGLATAKWAAAVAVLNDPRTAGAAWIDLRDPEHPLAGTGAVPKLPALGERAPRIASGGDDGLDDLEGADAGTTPGSAAEGGPATGTSAAAARSTATPQAAASAAPTTTSAAPASPATGATGTASGTAPAPASGGTGATTGTAPSGTATPSAGGGTTGATGTATPSATPATGTTASGGVAAGN